MRDTLPQTTRPPERRLTWALAGLALVLAGLWANAPSAPSVFHPQLSFEVGEPSPIKTEMTLQGVWSESACELVAGQLAASIRQACVQCRALSSACIKQHPEYSQSAIAQLFAGAAQGSVVGHFSGVVVRYQGANEELAYQACALAAEGQSKPVTQCFESNTLRPAVALLSMQTAPRGWQAADTFGLLAGLALLLVSLQLARAPLRVLGPVLITLPTWGKQLTLMAFDLGLVIATLWLALLIRLEGSLTLPLASLWPVFLVSPLVCLPIFYALSLYKAVMRFIGLAAIAAIAKAVLLAAAVSTLLVYLLQVEGVPRSVPVIQGLLMMIGLGASRALARFWLSSNEQARGTRRQVMIYGAGSAGVQLAAALAHSAEFRPVAMVDDSESMHARLVSGLRVYAPSQLTLAITKHKVAEIFLAMPSASVSRRKAIVEELAHLPVRVRTLPGVAGLAEGKVRVSDLRDVQIEDLLGRDPVSPEVSLLAATITDKVVLVTGAGGSIGSELCRQIIRLGPKQLIMLESSEFALYKVEASIHGLKGLAAPNLRAVLGSVVDRPAVEAVLREHGVQTIYHAAAYKHVPIVESNPVAGAWNNTIGTWVLAKAAQDCAVETFVLISTDKAVRPTNVMGATKRVAELCLQGLAQEESPDKPTRFLMVRFGNVLGSSGSVIPRFREQIAGGGPITVTDPRMVRYFMTIPEATQLVIQAAALGSISRPDSQRAGNAELFLLDMGEPVRILDLAQNMVRLSGLSVKTESNPGGDIEIAFTGIRPGEKLYEELLIGGEVQDTAHPRIKRALESSLTLQEVKSLIAELQAACERLDAEAVRAIVSRAAVDLSG